MHTEAHLVLEDVLMACKTLNTFGESAIKNLEHGVPNPLEAEEKNELARAFSLMRLTLDCVNPLIAATFDETTYRRVG